jgi:P4 family phage/plasmid primase-like protien
MSGRTERDNKNVALQQFLAFLKKYKMIGRGAYHTHTGMGYQSGSYNIPDDKNEEFMNLYGAVIGCPLYIVERPKPVGPYIIDIDFDVKESSRQYTQKDIENIVKICNDIINTYYVGDKITQAYVMEKNQSTPKKDEFKDGFHIIYPYLAASQNMRYLITHKLKLECIKQKVLDHIKFTNKISDVFDMRVIKSNGFMMYGSRKRDPVKQIDCPIYVLTKIYDENMDIIYNNSVKKNPPFKHAELAKILSNRKFNNEDECEINEDVDQFELAKTIKEVLREYGVTQTEKINHDNVPNTTQKKKKNEPLPENSSSDDSENDSDDNSSSPDDEDQESSDSSEDSDNDTPQKKRKYDSSSEDDSEESDSDIPPPKKKKNDKKKGKKSESSSEESDSDVPPPKKSKNDKKKGKKSESSSEESDSDTPPKKSKKDKKKKDKKIKEDLKKKIKEDEHKRNKDIKSKEINIAKKLVSIIDKRRAIEYDSWSEIGWTLHNISDTKLFDTFDEFSKKAGNKYDAKSCRNLWDKARSHGFTISRLKYYARIDNPKKYSKILRESISNLLEEASSGAEDDITKILFELYGDIYKCINIQQDGWYEFQGHKWVCTEAGYTLYCRISTDLNSEFANLASYFLQQCSSTNQQSNDSYRGKADKILKLMKKLKTTSFKNSIMKDCAKKFYDPKFEGLLDSNPDLIGFDNGIYDLKLMKFRAGNPSDLVSMTTGYNYKEYSFTHKHIVGIKDFFSKIMIEEDMREYVLTLLSSYLEGYIRGETFIIWTGCGSNGKSKTVELFQLALGDYATVLPVGVLTQKKGSASSPNSEIAQLRGIRFAALQEPEKKDEIQIGSMKEMTGGDYLYARKLFGHPFKFKPQFKLLLTCNDLPTIDGNDNGTWRRIRVTPFESEFTDTPTLPHQFMRDRELLVKLKQWGRAFMWLLLHEYFPKYKANDYKIAEPEKVTKHTQNYKKQSDIFLDFMDSNMKHTKKNSDFESIDMLYSALKHWYTDSYTGKCPYNKNDFHDYLSKNGYKCDKKYLYQYVFANEEQTPFSGNNDEE